jgi:2'-hydroxyisoflavone reductase
MSIDRRSFIKSSALIGGAIGLGVPALAEAFTADGVRPMVYRPETGDAQPKPLRILILGGTGFIGPQQVEYALQRGHKLTLFNRGQTNTNLFPTVPRLIGDRNDPNGHAALKKGTWDMVIDNPTTNPKWVRGAGEALKGRVGQYLFVSTISVFSDYSKPGMDENGPLHQPTDIDQPFDRDARFYGPNKVRSEMEAKAQFGEEKLVHDLSEWIVRCGENHTLGTFNATGPKSPTNIAEMLYGIKSVTTSDARFTFVPAEFLRDQQVRAWSEMPVWQPAMGPTLGFMQVNCSKAHAAGLTFRPLADTAKSTLDWYKTRPAAEQEKARAGIAPEKEKAVLAAWHAKAGR